MAKLNRPWLYRGFIGFHYSMHFSLEANPFIIILPTLMVGYKWIIQDVASERRYWSIRFAILLWSFELYFRGHKTRKRQAY